MAADANQLYNQNYGYHFPVKVGKAVKNEQEKYIKLRGKGY